MNARYNLIDEPWIVCTVQGQTAKPERRALGLRDVLVHAPNLTKITDPSPLVTVALHRLLLAILHRVFGPCDEDEWGEIQQHGRWDEAQLGAYLSRPDVYGRFDLFDQQRPFYQVAGIEPKYAAPISKLTHELAVGNNATLFDHSTEANAPVFTPAEAARYLVANQAYAVGGLVSFDDKQHKSATAAPLTKGATALVRGGTLFETLMLNLVNYDPEQGLPFKPLGEDMPAWERAEETAPLDRLPAGYLDLLTWQSRRIRLFPDQNVQGYAVVPRVAIMKGYGFLPGFERWEEEQMVAFGTREKAASGQDPHPPVGFRPERALWRDSLSLFQSAGDGSTRPKTLDWLYRLEARGLIEEQNVYPLDLFGMLTDKASVLLWRHERLPLPLAYLDPNNKNLIVALRQALDGAEEVGTALHFTGIDLAGLLLAPESDDPNARQPLRADKDKLAASFEFERSYWPRLEAPFKQLIEDLPHHRVEHEGMEEYGPEQLTEWKALLRDTAHDVFDAATSGLDSSARSLKAVAMAKRGLRYRVERALRGENVQESTRKGATP